MRSLLCDLCSLSCHRSLNIQLDRLVQVFRDVLAVLFALLDELGQKILDLSVYRAEIIFRTLRDGIV